MRIPFLLLVLLCSLPVAAGWVMDEQGIMGTVVRAQVWHADDDVARGAVDAVMGEMRRIDALMSPFRDDSELSHLNREAAAGPVAVSDELLGLIDRALGFSRITAGAFDITFASAGRLYDYREGKRPTDNALARVLPAIDYRFVHLDEANGTVSFSRAGVKIDLGGIAKGHAVDRALHLLRERGVSHALVSAGGDTGILGDRLGRPWMVGIRDPRNRDRMVALLPLRDEALSTSGDYERFFVEDGVRYHHILNPGTGVSARSVRSVSILGPDATTTDALSTSVFVLGVKRGMALIDGLQGVEAVIVDQAGELYYSAGLRTAETVRR